MKCMIRLLFVVFAMNPLLLVRAQTEYDSLSLAKMFIQICNHYQYAPLQLRIQIKNSVNYVTSETDTVYSALEMDINGSHSYINTGSSAEQIMDDSLLVIVNKISKVLVVYPVTSETKQKINRYLNSISLTDSSAKKLSDYYSLSQIASGEIAAKSRRLAGRSSLPYSELLIKYNTNDTVLQELTQITRSPVSIDSSTYVKLSNDNHWLGKVFTTENGEWYLIKEQITGYVYNQITHKDEQPLINVKNRLLKDSKGNFYPAKGYEDYRISKNL